MKFKKSILAGVLAVLAIGGYAAAPIAQPTIPQVTQINPNDLFQDIPNGSPSAQSYYASAALLGNYSPTLGGNNSENIIIGGDATTNLFQRGTTGSSVTTAITYGGPDRWAYWSGTGTAMTVSRDSTAGDLPTSNTFQYAFKMARTSGQTGVVQMCMIQEVESANAYALAGQTAEIDFHADAGANFSAASSNLAVYLITGTSTDEGVSKAAFNLNAGGGGSGAWTGQVNTAVTVPISAVGARYTVAVPVPATASEVAVAICYTPVGTAGTNDYVALAGIQLTRNSALTSVAGTAGAVLNANDPRAKSFNRRSQALETTLQQRYFYRITESATVIGQRALCAVSTTSLAVCQIKFPVTMRIAPVMTYTAGFALTGSAQTGANVCAAVRTSTTLTGAAATNEIVPIDCTSSAAFGAAGTIAQLYDLGTGSSTGIISANADF